ncbi:isoquinoline 1-oxidoreductase (plasmid) [Gemmobacter aquarius]|uniref:Isoquinoline 1-oxidoreductase n=1 Tax=Paragemmobacter aquarius TaxID=2169400 RepID=A0A2S0US61_9RHOB|nr:molybdopterin cofactor-binding domain-containing protein [Gemmobacter aquarius]AWB50656.1 isoquinoline 1-oxidoreductase [Gemmobacter aquarius]
MGTVMKIARRGFLFGSVAILGGVAFGWWKFATPYGNPVAGGLNPYVMIDGTGVTIIAPRAEMGQGVHTTLAALVAEEMDLTLEQVRVIHGPASAAYYNSAVLGEGVPFAPTDTGWLAEAVRGAMEVPAKFLGLQITGGSSSVPDAFDKMRLAGAAARSALVQAAAGRLGVPVGELRTEGGFVIAPDGTRLGYVDLAEAAAGVTLESEPVLKDRAEWTLLGKSQPRVDAVAKSTGAAVYTADLRLPGMLYATVRTNPRLGGAVKGYDASVAEGMAGVVKVVPVDGGAAVIARTTWQAMQAAGAIAFDWGDAPYPATSAELGAVLAASFTEERRDSVNRDDGDVDRALVGDVFEVAYSVPYLAHATMEPMTAAALLKDGALTVWAGHQLPTQILVEGAALTGLPAEAVTVNTMLMGGGFGRRAEMDVIRQVIALAKAVEGQPVLLTWSREEDMTHDGYRPAALARVRAKLDGGKIAAFDFATCSSSVVESQAGRLGYSVPGPDGAIVQGAWEQPYRFAHHRVTGYRAPAMVPVGSWRSVGASQNAFFHESAVDELAHLAGVDPVAFRLGQIDHGPSRKVIEAVAEMSDWGTRRAGRAKGIAFCMSFGVPVAEVIEVEETAAGLRMTGAWAAADVGIALDPGNIEAQVSGAMVYGLSAAIRGEITFADGMAEQSTFWDFEPLRMPQCPPIAVRVLEGLERIRGIGEPGLPPAAPALANAIFALTGQRIRELPLGKAVGFA